MKTFILYPTILSLFLTITLYAEPPGSGNSLLHGTVESNGTGVPYATIYVKGSHHGTASTGEGSYRLQLSPGKHMIRVQSIGYQACEIEIDIAENQSLQVNFDIDPDIRMIEEIVVSGSRIGQLRMLPGSVSIIGQKDLKERIPLSGNEMLRSVPGLHVVEEEGAGLRLNIGIRGLDPDKSRTVLILEDGIPVALGPYGEPEMYFTPAIERMSGLEVLKGNGQILYGPQTIGGVVNYITADPPETSSGKISVKGGKGGYFTGTMQYGTTFGNSGIMISYLRKQADKLGPTSFRLNDLSLKYKATLNQVSSLMVKMNVYDENSNSTYVGLTQPMFDEGGNDYLVIAPNDNLDVRRYAASAVHDYRINGHTSLKTTLFGYTTTRNWRRQDFSSSSASNSTGVVYGDPDLPGGAIFMRNSTGNRDRQFEVVGFEPRLQSRFFTGTLKNQLDAGIRFLFERAFEQRGNGQTADAVSGNLQENEIRTGYAGSAYLQNKFIVSSNLTITAGLRYESLLYDRTILRLQYQDTLIGSKTSLQQLIPGAGFNLAISPQLDIFGGVHRGFAPPRIKDAISNSGENLQLGAEKSWNIELGSRTRFAGVLDIEFTSFVMDFSNQVIPVSESSGGQGSGFINGGRTLHKGLELSLSAKNIAFGSSGYKSGFLLNATFAKSTFSSDRFVVQKIARTAPQDTTLLNINGNRTPYAPEWMLNGQLSLDSPSGLSLRVVGTYTGVQFTDVLNTPNPYDYIELAATDPGFRWMQATANGRIGELPSTFLVDASAVYIHEGSGLEFSASVKNLLNERYISSRRPQGIRVGLPRYIIIGIAWSF